MAISITQCTQQRIHRLFKECSVLPSQLAEDFRASGAFARAFTGQQSKPFPELLSTTSVLDRCEQVGSFRIVGSQQISRDEFRCTPCVGRSSMI
jgi:hypothetical protein